MKYLVISDIHGSSFYAEKIQEIYIKECPDKMILLGDLYYHGPRNSLTQEYHPMKVCDILNQYKNIILCTKGNCDAEVDEMISEFEMKEYIELNINGVDFFFSHGHKYNIDHLPPVGKVVIYGHFHTGFITEEYGIILANPGSIALPKNNTKHSYLVIDDTELILKDIDGNIIDRKSYVK